LPHAVLRTHRKAPICPRWADRMCRAWVALRVAYATERAIQAGHGGGPCATGVTRGAHAVGGRGAAEEGEGRVGRTRDADRGSTG
jgi:hypothetical protein